MPAVRCRQWTMRKLLRLYWAFLIIRWILEIYSAAMLFRILSIRIGMAGRRIRALPAINGLSLACYGKKHSSSALIFWRRDITRIQDHEDTGIYSLLRGTDRRKDQSYVLYQLNQDLLPHILFPMADLEKTHTRELAKAWNLPVFDKPESQDICFIPDNDYKGFLRQEDSAMFRKGNFVDRQGHIVGQHQGIPAYTIGQRRGLHLGGPGGPYYVTALDVAHNTVVVGAEKDLFSAEVHADDVSWVETAPTEPLAALGKIRYAAQESPCTVYPKDDGTIRVVFLQPQRAVTSGQALVLYDAATGERVLGGGVIL